MHTLFPWPSDMTFWQTNRWLSMEDERPLYYPDSGNPRGHKHKNSSLHWRCLKTLWLKLIFTGNCITVVKTRKCVYCLERITLESTNTTVMPLKRSFSTGRNLGHRANAFNKRNSSSTRILCLSCGNVTYTYFRAKLKWSEGIFLS